MNGLFGFGWIDTLVKLIVLLLTGIVALLIRGHYRNQEEAE